MHVHLIKTPDYPAENFTEVIDLLRTFDGPISFVSSQINFQRDEFYFLKRSIDRSALQMLEKKMYVGDRGMPLSWKELFSLCSHYRKAADVPAGDIIILLTERINMMNWFSMIDGENNAFVNCADWHLFTDAPPKYPIAYQVLANVLRCLMKPDLSQIQNLLHEPPIGCMNDFCRQKSNVILKLKTADICQECHRRLSQEHVPASVISQALQVFEGIRKQFIFKTSVQTTDPIGPIQVNRNRKLLFPDKGNLELRLNPLESTLYVFYLLHPEGVRLNELSDHRAELLQLYRRFSVHDNDEVIQTRLDNLINPLSNSFSEQKSRLNRKIRDLIPRQAQHYIIKGEPGAPFKIGLPEELIQIQEII